MTSLAPVAVTPPAFDIDRFSGSPRISTSAAPAEPPPLSQFSSRRVASRAPQPLARPSPVVASSVRIERLGGRNDTDPLWKAAKEFEGLMLGQMFGLMMASSSTKGLFGGGHAEKVYQSFLMQAFGESIAEHGGIGIAKAVYREIAVQS